MRSIDTAIFGKLETYIAGTGNCDSTTNPGDNCVDGWYKDFYPYGNRERNVGQATLLGGLVTFSTYQPFSDVCQAEGESYLYGVYYKTGTSWYENVFGDQYGLDEYENVQNKMDLGRGMTTTPNLFTGGGEEGAKAFVQTSTGAIVEIKQENLPIGNYKTGRASWKEYERLSQKSTESCEKTGHHPHRMMPGFLFASFSRESWRPTPPPQTRSC